MLLLLFRIVVVAVGVGVVVISSSSMIQVESVIPFLHSTPNFKYGSVSCEALGIGNTVPTLHISYAPAVPKSVLCVRQTMPSCWVSHGGCRNARMGGRPYVRGLGVRYVHA